MTRWYYYVFFLIITAACSEGRLSPDQDPDRMYQRAAWESLSEEDQQTVTHDWREAAVSECLFYEDQRAAVCVTFHTNLDPLLGPIIVYLEPGTCKILGTGPRF